MKKLFAQGANIHAVDDYGDMAAQTLVLHFCDEFYYAGENTKGSGYFKDGVFSGAKFDVAAWAVFENLASAQSFDMKKAASNK